MILVPPTAEQQSLLRKLNNEDIASRDRDLEATKQWLKQEPHLPDALDDDALLNFLRWGKFSLEKTKKRLDKYFTVRNAFSDFYTRRDITRPELQLDPQSFTWTPLPVLSPEGRRICVATSPRCDFHAEDTISFAKIVVMMADIRVYVEEGVHDVYILDASAVLLKNLPNVSISTIKSFLVCALEAYPVRIKELHIINATPLVSAVMKWAARFVKDKLMKRVKIHDSLESLHECFSKDLLPEELGGTAGKLAHFRKQWMSTLEEYTEWFKEKEDLKADESKRVEKDVTCGGLYGVDGSFKRLTID
ncbi:hypothetical protein Zmor_020351 [Zophobas morio]|uniref:CRAL-TRIO domain-containing protein n=1 Tax=Zophobas morio TaxID=2755281 RepID=A0AA38I361_9CUCU|nr:hypothetical protein Zmor_020351 [Zophobas morio]